MLNKISPYYQFILLLAICLMFTGCGSDDLRRISYISELDRTERDYFLYLPQGYEFSDKDWPVLMFLHGNGERGNGKEELDYVMMHGPLMEAWVMKRDLPFIIIAPQLHMAGMDSLGYIANRKAEYIPRRLEKGVPEAQQLSRPAMPMEGSPAEPASFKTLPSGWEMVQTDLMAILDQVHTNFRTDTNRVYLTGLSYGGFGTWITASNYPERFTAIAPVAGWGHPDFMPHIAEQKIPVWAFAGGRDQVVPVRHFYPGLNRLEELGHDQVRFTVHEDTGHDVWKRVYAGEDLYSWLLKQE